MKYMISYTIKYNYIMYWVKKVPLKKVMPVNKWHDKIYKK